MAERADPAGDGDVVGAATANWHPCLLAEITPHDGPAPTGNHVWDDNNLAQKNISIVDTDVGDGLRDRDGRRARAQPGEAPGARDHPRPPAPRQVQLYVDLVDPKLRRHLRALSHQRERIVFDQDPPVHGGMSEGILTLPGRRIAPALIRRPETQWTLGFHDGREVVLLKSAPRQLIPVYNGPGQFQPVIVGGTVGAGARPGEYEVVIIQRDQTGRVTGSATMVVRIDMQT